MFQTIFTNVPASEVAARTADIVDIDNGTLVSSTQETDGQFTIIAEFPGDPPPDAPAGAGAFPWMAIADGELASGVKEMRSNPRIEEYFATTTFGRHPDSEPWCSAFVNFCVTQSGVAGTNSALALSWLDWGQEAGGFIPGCIVVLSRGTPGQGHVGFFVGEDANGSIRLLGGNQHDSVNVSNFPTARVLGRRVPLPAQLAAADAPAPVPAPAGPGAPTVVAEDGAGADDGFGGLARHAFDFFVQSGWTQAQAAGLIANIQVESNFRANALGDGGAAHGICQWHQDRFDKFPICFPGRTIDGSTFDEQLQFVNFELLDPRSADRGQTQPSEHGAAQHLRAAADARTAGGVVSQFYERPLDVEGNIALRGGIAEKWFSKFVG